MMFVITFRVQRKIKLLKLPPTSIRHGKVKLNDHAFRPAV